MINLTEQQQKAVDSIAHQLVILAGCGTGKTTVLTHRIARLLQRPFNTPQSIIVTTFTRKAAQELKMRLTTLVSAEKVQQLNIGTFHSICLRLLRRNVDLVPQLKRGFSIVEPASAKAIIRAIIKTRNPRMVTSRIKEVLEQVLKLKQGFDTFMLGMGFEHEVLNEYNRQLRAANQVDFEDFQLFTLNLLRNHPEVVSGITHMLIDEFQDTSSIQFEIMRETLNASQADVSVVGDPDQSIYGWRNANPHNFNDFFSAYPNAEQVVIEENFRSTKRIVDVAHRMIKQQPCRVEKGLYSNHIVGSPVEFHEYYSVHSQAAGIADDVVETVRASQGALKYSDFAILIRANAQAKLLQDALIRRAVPYVSRQKQAFFERAEVKHLLNLVKASIDERDIEAFRVVMGAFGSTISSTVDSAHPHGDAYPHISQCRKHSRIPLECLSRSFQTRQVQQPLSFHDEPR